MDRNDCFILSVGPEEVRKKAFRKAEELIELLCSDEETIRDQDGKLFLDLSAFAESGREAFEDDAVRAWVIELDRRYPFLPYFLFPRPEQAQIRHYAAHFVPFFHEGDRLQFDRQKLEHFALEKIKAIHAFCTEHDLDPRESIRRLCEQLDLDVIEEVAEEKHPYPFEPEIITSPFLKDFFESGYYFHTIDASDEPVLFILVEDPVAAYYAKLDLDIEFFNSSAYPVISLEMSLYDIPEAPMKMSFVFNVDVERHCQELYAYSEMSYITTNFLFNRDGNLYYAFTRAVDLSDALREQIRSLILEASNRLRVIPKESRSFSQAVSELFASKAGGEPEMESPDAGEESGEDISADSAEPETEFEEVEEEEWPQGDPESGDSEAVFAARKAVEPAPEGKAGDSDSLEILQEIEIVTGSMDELPASGGLSDQQWAAPSPHPSDIPASVLPESIQRITRALSKPVRRPAKNVTEELAVKPAPKKVVMRNEDQLERLSRRLLIMQNKLEKVQRENIRLRNELNNDREEIERLQRENLALENSKWKFWK